MRKVYSLFKNFVLRTPLLPITSLNQTFFKSEIFKEALYLASRDLYNAVKLQEGNEFSQYPSNLQMSLMKYFLRMSSRSTPFGIFAGCGLGTLGLGDSDEKILIGGFDSNRTVTRLDMDFVAILSEVISKDQRVKEKLLYFPNNTIYKVGRQYRYIDYKYINKKRSYLISEIDTNEYIIKALNFAQKGILINDLVDRLSGEGEYTAETISAFVNALIENQILINELYPTVTGEEATARLLRVLTSPNLAATSTNFVTFLNKITKMLGNIDNAKLGRPVEWYLDIEEGIKEIGISYNPQYLFQSDMFSENTSLSLNSNVADSLYDALIVINKLTRYRAHGALKAFKDAFLQRYEHEEVPLTDALDPDVGLGFAQFTPEMTVQNPLLDNVFLENRQANNDLTLNQAEYMLLRKYHDFLRNDLDAIEITEEDVASFLENYDDLPVTMATMVELLGANEFGRPMIFMNNLGSSSAANLLTRFAQGSDAIHNFVREIIDLEEMYLKADQLLAEIVHLPESRTGNILYRPILRNYEIPYLAMPAVDEEHTIPISDLMISLTAAGELILKSRSLNKQILPRLSSAHNFTINSLPIYHFLCLFQYEGIRSNIAFSWGGVLSAEKHLPRVFYKNVIFSPASWQIEEQEIAHLNKFGNDEFSDAFLKFVIKRQLPDKFLVCVGDNKLFININDPLAVKLFLSEVRKYKKIKVEEFLYNLDDMVVEDAAGNGYTNQIIFCFHKNELN